MTRLQNAIKLHETIPGRAFNCCMGCFNIFCFCIPVCSLASGTSRGEVQIDCTECSGACECGACARGSSGAISYGRPPEPTALGALLQGVPSPDQYTWDLDVDTNELRLHITEQLATVLPVGSWRLIESIQVGPTWTEGRTLFKLHIVDPSKREA